MGFLSGKQVLLGVTGGIAAYKSAELVRRLRERGADDVVVFGGGIIPAADIPGLLGMGMSAVFTPGSSAKEIVTTVDRLLSDAQVS